jgi:hypothetical protein
MFFLVLSFSHLDNTNQMEEAFEQFPDPGIEEPSACLDVQSDRRPHFDRMDEYPNLF